MGGLSLAKLHIFLVPIGIFTKRFALCGNVRDKIIMTTGIVIVIADIIHNVSADITPPNSISPGLKSPLYNRCTSPC